MEFGRKEVLFDLFHLFRILSWRTLQAQTAAKWLRYKLFILFWFRPKGTSTGSKMFNTAPSLSNNLFTKGSPRDRYCGFVSSGRNESTTTFYVIL